MILTVTPNPAYDVTYRLPGVELGTVHRVNDVRERAGGKGINVARVLAHLGEQVCAVGFGDTAFAAALDEEGLANDLVPGLSRVRRTVVVHGDDEITSFWERGAAVPADAGDRLCERVAALLDRVDGVVISGSLPPGCDPALPARLAQLAIDAGVPALVDADGEALRQAAHVPGIVLAPNADEVRALGDPADDVDGVADACMSVVRTGAHAVIATLGADGVLAVTRDGAWRATPDRTVAGNPTGAGDAAAAAIMRHLARDDVDWARLLTDTVATSAAAVAAPVAGEIDDTVRDGMRPGVSHIRDHDPRSGT